jgi:uncharacterized protein YjbI with pentapeptide repeats
VAQCRYHTTCGLDVEDQSTEGLCILHSTNPAKDTHAFTEVLTTHRERNGDNFADFVFPQGAYFSRVTFHDRANFRGAIFCKRSHFGGATFTKEASFVQATFHDGGYFGETTFTKEATFYLATFTKDAMFLGTTFLEGVHFGRATFRGSAVFGGATFTKEANFSGSTFREKTIFREATFSGRTLFAPFSGAALMRGPPESTQVGYIFAGVEIDFRKVVINPPDAVTFLEADLTRCRFLETDLRKVQLVGVTWPREGRHTVVYDDIAPVNPEERIIRPWSQIERLYRELKQNYEDRRDYERAGDFHYSEKEIRRQNPETNWVLRLFLTLYWLFSGYGERYLRPLLWAGLLFVGSTIGYLW